MEIYLLGSRDTVGRGIAIIGVDLVDFLMCGFSDCHFSLSNWMRQ